jgi:hypothetical protein
MEDIQAEWASFAKRIQAKAAETLENNASDGIAIVSMHIAVDSNGRPLVWVITEPKRVEPSKNAKETLIKLLSSG